MESLLTLFKTSSQSKELMMVSSLAIIYLFPSLLDRDTLSSNHIHSVIECLEFLVQSTQESTEIDISSDEIRTASAFAMTNMWFKVLVAKLAPNSGSEAEVADSKRLGTADSTTNNKQDPFLRLRRRSSLSQGGPEYFTSDELINAFASLSIMAAKSEASRQDENTSGQGLTSNVYYEFTLIVESICAWEHAMPTALNEGVIMLLLRWLSSGDSDLERSAANALRNLTLTKNDYTAGWVQSQLLQMSALSHMVGRLESPDSRVRLAMAEAILGLTKFPHTREGIVEAQGVKYLVQLLANATDVQTRDEALMLAAGNSLLQLSTETGRRNGTSPFLFKRKAQALLRKERVIE